MVIDDPALLDAFAADWPRLRTDVPGPMMHLEWIRAQAEALPSGDRLCAIALLTEGRLTALAPLVRTGAIARRLTWLDTGDVSGALYADERELQHLVRAIYAMGRPVRIGVLVPGSPTQRALVSGRPRHWLRTVRPHVGGPSLRIDPTWADPIAKLGDKRRAELQRTRRKAERIGKVSFTACTPTVDEAGALFDEFVDLEARGWKGEARTALAWQAQTREGLRAAQLAAASMGTVRVTRMRIGDATAAMHLNFVGDGGWWGIKGAIDETFKSVTPGLHLFAFTIGRAAEEGFERFEFMGTTAPFKEIWGAPGVELQRHWTGPPTVDTALTLTRELAWRGYRRTRQRLHRACRR